MNLSTNEKKLAVERDNPKLSVSRQCALLGLSKSSLCYGRPKTETAENMKLMDLIDRQYTKTPFYGSRRMTICLQREGHAVNRKRVRRLMSAMGIEGISPKRNTSKKAHSHKIYPYLLRGLDISSPHHVWASDITYLRVRGGFAFLVAVMDWFSRSILSWRLSNSLDTAPCLEAVEEAVCSFGIPEIFNTDQGCQYTSNEFVGALLGHGIRISMDGKGRALDNVMVERFWRTLKYEEVYLNNYAEKTMEEAWKGLTKYIDFYNKERMHTALANSTPYGVLFTQGSKGKGGVLQRCGVT